MEHDAEVEVISNDLTNIVLRIQGLGARSPHRINLEASADNIREALDHLKLATRPAGLVSADPPEPPGTTIEAVDQIVEGIQVIVQKINEALPDALYKGALHAARIDLRRAVTNLVRQSDYPDPGK